MVRSFVIVDIRLFVCLLLLSVSCRVVVCLFVVVVRAVFVVCCCCCLLMLLCSSLSCSLRDC